MGTTLQIQTLGNLTISIDDTPVTGFDSRKVQALLVYLACTRRTAPREVLAELFWEERAQGQASANLRVVLTSLRQTVEPFIEITRESVGLKDGAEIRLDTREFEAQLSASGDDLARIEAALELYQGDFLAGFFVDSTGFEEWATLERERLRFRAMEAIDTLIVRYQEYGAYATGLTAATRLLQMDALREKTHRQLMDLLAQSGQRVAALNQYATCQRLLKQELGIDPAPETVVAYENILAGLPQSASRPLVRISHDDGDDAQPLSVENITNPYKGLRPFLEDDAPDFFGREVLVAQLVVRLRDQHRWARFLAVVGPSGSGKSSAVRAGLIPALRNGALPGSEQWWIAVMQPGAHPLLELEAALTQQTANPKPDLLDLLEHDSRGLLRALKRMLPPDERVELCLVIDQFEELFSLTDDEAVRAHLLDSLFTALNDPRSRLRLILTLRADFYDWPLLYPDFGELVRQRTEVILPLSPSELQRAIQSPVEQLGLSVERELVPAIVADVGSQPGGLPLLQHTLYELFERRDGRTLTLSAYQATGGVQGALLRRAEDVYQQLVEDQHPLARQIFLRLVQLNEGGEDTRRRVPASEVTGLAGSEAAAQRVIDPFARYRLLTFDRDALTHDPTLEVAHEALIRTWPRLRTWLDESRDDIRQQRLLATAATEWETAGRDRSYLLTGSRLAQFEGWATSTSIALTPDELDYFNTSLAEHERQVSAERERQTRELLLARRATNRLRYLVAGLGIFLIAALALALFAAGKQREAENARAASDANAATARDLAIVNGAQAALAKGDPDTALALAVAANQTDHPSAQAQLVLSEAAYSPGTVRVYDVNHRQSMTNVSLSPDGHTAVSSSWGSTVTVWDIETGEILHELLDYSDGWTVGILSPDGSLVLTTTGNTEGTEEVEMALWDTASGNLVRTFDTERVLNTCILITRRFSPDGRWYVGSNGGGFGCSPDGKAELLIWDVNTGHVARVIDGFEQGLLGAEFSPDNRTILTVMNDATLAVIDADTGQILRQFGEKEDTGTIGWFNDILFTPDAQTAITVRSTGTVIVWDLETYHEIRRFEAGPNWIRGYADLSADGRTLVVASMWWNTQANMSNNQSISLWDVPSGIQLGSITVPGQATSVEFLPDEQEAVVALGLPLLRLIDLQDGAQVNRFPMDGLMPYRPTVPISPDGHTLLACIESYVDDNGDTFCQVALFDATTGAEIQRIGSPMALDEMRFSADGQRVVLASNATGADEYLATVWDMSSNREVGRFVHTARVGTAAFSPDGSRILLGDTNGLGILWDMTTDQEIARLKGHTLAINDVEFSPDGRTALTSSQDGLMILWDASTGQEIRQFTLVGPINGVEFSPDGHTAISGSDDSLVRLWDLNTGTELRRFVGHTVPVYAVHFSPDASTIFSSGVTEAILEWDVATGQAIRRYPRSSDWDFTLSPDGQSLFIPYTGPGSAVFQYRVDSAEELLAWTLEHRYNRDLTCEERAQYQIEPLCE